VSRALVKFMLGKEIYKCLASAVATFRGIWQIGVARLRVCLPGASSVTRPAGNPA
jgi:hypothetical protein